MGLVRHEGHGPLLTATVNDLALSSPMFAFGVGRCRIVVARLTDESRHGGVGAAPLLNVGLKFSTALALIIRLAHVPASPGSDSCGRASHG